MPISPFFSRLAVRLAIVLAAGALAACSVDVDQGGGGGYRPRPQACTMEYMPVCGARGGDLQTFANACEARSSGFRVVGRGECRRGDRPGGLPDGTRACTREYAPVCGERGRSRQTFANACEARSSGYSIVGRGECQVRRPDRNGTDAGWNGNRDPRDRNRDRDSLGRDRPRDNRACTMEYNPVCGRRGADFKEFGNACSAQAAGFQVFKPGQCPVR